MDETRYIQIYATLENLSPVAAELRTMLAQMGVVEELAGSCELALQELLTNLVHYACNGDPTQTIDITLSASPTHLLIATTDWGVEAAINLEEISMPDPDDLQVGGYGLAILKALVDDVSYRRENGKNQWTLQKRLV